MTSFNSNTFESDPSGIDASGRGSGRIATFLDALAGPLAIGASGLTFFLASTLAVPPADDLRVSITPVPAMVTAEPTGKQVTMLTTDMPPLKTCKDADSTIATGQQVAIHCF